MTKPKVPTTKAKAFGQAPKAGRAKAPPATPLSKAAGQRPQPSPANDQAPTATNAPRIPFKSQAHLYQPPEAANGDDDAMGQEQD